MMTAKHMGEVEFPVYHHTSKPDTNAVCMTSEDYYCGFTSDSHPAFSVSPDAGQMERRTGPPPPVTARGRP